MDTERKIIVALDTDVEQARSLALALKGTDCWLKVGMTLYYSAGPGIVAELKDKGFNIFVDLKLHDIPHQVRGAACSVVKAGADMLSVHASGGEDMMKAACEGALMGFVETGPDPDRKFPLCLAITVLTSLDTQALESTGISDEAEIQVLRLGMLAYKAGMQGVVCSPQEATMLRQQLGNKLTIVTPGIRPIGSVSGDQARVATPASALGAGADYLVIGRPITEAEDPRAAFEAIVEEMEK